MCKVPKDFLQTLLERKIPILFFLYSVEDAIYFVNRRQLFAALDIKRGTLLKDLC